MPKITNKVTGKKETVTDDGLKAIQGNELTAKLYTYETTEEPKEVTDLKATTVVDEAPTKGKNGK